MTWSGKTPTATSSAGIVRPASAGRGSGIAPVITAKKSGLPRRSTPPKSAELADHENSSALVGLYGRHRRRRPGLGFCLSHLVGTEKSRGSPRLGGEAGTGRTPGRQKPALAP